MKAVRILISLLLLAPLLSAGEVIDRVVAVVNHVVILQSDWDETLRYEAFMAGKPLTELSSVDAKVSLDRLIDQQLLREQMRGFHASKPAPADVNRKLDEVRKLYPNGNTESGWRAALVRYGLSEPAVNQRVVRELKMMQFIDMRLRPDTKISQQSVEEYYREKLLPKLPEKEQTLTADVGAKIQELLTQEKVNELLNSWLKELRQQADVQVQAGPEVLFSPPTTASRSLGTAGGHSE